jgi:hypothetical protein
MISSHFSAARKLGYVVAVGDSSILWSNRVFEMKLIGSASEPRCPRPTKLRRVVVFGRQELPEMGPDLQKKTPIDQLVYRGL